MVAGPPRDGESEEGTGKARPRGRGWWGMSILRTIPLGVGLAALGSAAPLQESRSVPGNDRGVADEAAPAERFVYAHSLRGLTLEEPSEDGSDAFALDSLRPLFVSMVERRLDSGEGRVEGVGDELRVFASEEEHLAVSAFLDALRVPPQEPCPYSLTVVEVRSDTEPWLPDGDGILSSEDHRALLETLRREGPEIRSSRGSVAPWTPSEIRIGMSGVASPVEVDTGPSHPNVDPDDAWQVGAEALAGSVLVMPTELETCALRARLGVEGPRRGKFRELSIELSMHGAAWFRIRRGDDREFAVGLRVLPPESWVRRETTISVRPWIGTSGSSPEGSGVPFARHRRGTDRTPGGDDFLQRRRDLLGWLAAGGFAVRRVEEGGADDSGEPDPLERGPRARVDDEGRLTLWATESERRWVRNFLERNRSTDAWIGWVELEVWVGPRRLLEGRLEEVSVLTPKEHSGWSETLERESEFVLEGEPTFGVPTLGLSRIQNLRQRDFLVGYRATHGGRAQRPVIETQVVGLDLSVRPAWSAGGRTLGGGKGSASLGIALSVDESHWEQPIDRKQTPHGPIDQPTTVGARAFEARFLATDETLAVWIPTSRDRARLVFARVGFRRR